MVIGSLRVEVARRDASEPVVVIVLQVVSAPDPRAETFQVAADDLFVSGEDEGLERRGTRSCLADVASQADAAGSSRSYPGRRLCVSNPRHSP